MEETNTLLIERYFREELSEEELALFNKRMQEDSSFAQAVELERTIVSAIQSKKETQLQHRLNKIHEEEIAKVSTTTKQLPRRRNWLAAASVAALLGIALFFLIPSSSPTPQELYATHYQPPSFEIARTGQDLNPLLDAAQKAYNQHEYKKTITPLETLLDSQYNEKYALVLGASYLATNQYEQALATFQQAQQQTNLKDDATWYLAMTYLKKGEIDLAKQALEKLRNGTIPTTPKRQALAQTILDNL